MKNWKHWLLIFAILGIYIGIRTGGDICNGSYRQGVLEIIVMKPWLPGTWHIYLGYTNKHWESVEETYKRESKDGQKKEQHNYYGCAVYHRYQYEDGIPDRYLIYSGYNYLFIDLLYPIKPIMDPIRRVEI